ncbi:hypothetical protein [Enterococcus pallens]|uniref:Uncharacterized protein n=1 Tax=Enterococcus pallens ATCC BAA-351 TaxID=1158607 RepID=R2SE61_9ENTE|nr:hypothetical protein [Enterococcus pallens]EOH93820.1 hypothetical protein UAU_02516 [Enterococcus pallens ATCC BAA-351]EOU24660.1 hypothetical protein I588_00647 [Enterococcus pallens ATCC BAA-351]
MKKLFNQLQNFRTHSMIPVRKLLFFILCITSITIGWTSARYTTDLYALSDEARSATFSYKITNEVFKVDSQGNELSKYSNSVNDWETKPAVNFYDLDTGNGNDQAVQQKLKVVFNIKIDTETLVRFKLSRTIPERSLDIEKVEFAGEGISPIVVSEPAALELLSYEIPISKQSQNYVCTVFLRHDGQAEYDWTTNPETGRPTGYLADKYINLITSFEQVD